MTEGSSKNVSGNGNDATLSIPSDKARQDVHMQGNKKYSKCIADADYMKKET